MENGPATLSCRVYAHRQPNGGGAMSRVRFALGILLLAASGASGAEVVILKSTNNAAWRPVLDGLRRASPTHTFVEHDFQGDRARGLLVLEGLKGKPVIL